ncbi:hypothetical protein D3C81_1274490 [compost metagenome]
MHQGRAGLLLHARAFGLACGLGCRATPQRGAVADDVGQLGGDRTFRHHHMAGNATRTCGQRQGGAMVARRMRHHAIAGLLGIERPHRVAGAPEFERPAALQVLRLEVQAGTGHRVQFARTQHRRDRCVGRDTCRCRQYLGESGQGEFIHGERLA